MTKNKGWEIEGRMRRFFKGKPCPHDEVDFQTSKCLYEVKSCKLFNRCTNGNDKRNFKKKKHKKIETLQHGRFYMVTNNHILLFLRAIQLNKVPKYIFVLKIGKQTVFKVLNWEDVMLTNEKDYHYISIKEVFGDWDKET